MEEYTLDPNVVASALKLYLRELPDSLIPQKLASKFEAAAGIIMYMYKPLTCIYRSGLLISYGYMFVNKLVFHACLLPDFPVATEGIWLYRIALNFRGSKFSRLAFFEDFVEIIS